MLGALESQQRVLVRHGRPAEPRPAIAHVLSVVNPVVAQRLALLPGSVIARHDANRAPASSAKGAGKGQSVACSEFVVALLSVDPQTRKQCSMRQPAAATRGR